VIMWKSQSPWSALRGNLYDSFLATNGGYWGVKQATSSNSLISPTSMSSTSSGSSSSSSGGGSSRKSSDKKGGERLQVDQLFDKSKFLHVQLNQHTLTCGVMNRASLPIDVSNAFTLQVFQINTLLLPFIDDAIFFYNRMMCLSYICLCVCRPSSLITTWRVNHWANHKQDIYRLSYRQASLRLV
jgi:hypothetical protein